METKLLTGQDKLRIKAITDFWYPWAGFDRHSHEPSDPRKMQALWMGGLKETDEYISKYFKADLEATVRGEKEHWLQDKDGLLAYVLLTDQFSRNIYRRHRDAFSSDHLALKVVKQLFSDSKEVEKYKHFERVFLIFPFMHSENSADVETCCSYV